MASSVRIPSRSPPQIGCALRVERRDRFMEPARQLRGGIAIGHDFDIGTSAAPLRVADRIIEFPAGGDVPGKPPFAAERLGQLVVMPFGEVVVVALGIRKEQPLDQIAVIVHHEDDRFQSEAMELADFLRWFNRKVEFSLSIAYLSQLISP